MAKNVTQFDLLLSCPSDVKAELELLFAERNNIEIPDDFYYMGNLSIVQNPMGGGPHGFNPSNTLAGGDDEKKKYKLILELKERCSEYQQSYNYFSQIDSKVFLALSLSNGGHDIICYNQKYLKQNTNSYFPSYLLFNSFPEVIKYEITSKRCQNVVKGELDCKKSGSKE